MRSEHAPVGIQTRGSGVIVAGGQMYIAPQSPLFAPYQHQHLGVGLVADHTVHNMCADFFQAGSPVQVGFFIKPCHQLHHHSDFLAATRCVDEVFH